MTCSRQLLYAMLIFGVTALGVPAVGAQGAGYNWESYALAPGESWEGSTAGAAVRTGPFLQLRLDESGKLSVPYKVGFRLTGSFSCLSAHDIEVTIRVAPTGQSWSTASWDPPSKEKLTFRVPAGSHPNGVDWSEQDGPSLAIQWDLSQAPENSTATYLVVASPMPPQAPADCQPQAAKEGMRYLSRLNVTEIPSAQEQEDGLAAPAKGKLGIEGAVFSIMTALGVAFGRSRYK